MSDLGNKQVFSANLRRIMDERGITRKQICSDLGFIYTTFNDWYNGRKYPRIDKIEQLAGYFHILKSDLIESVTYNNLLKNTQPYNPTHRIPILGCISAGRPVYAEENIEGYTYTDLNGNAEYFALRVHGDSMNAVHILDGKIIIVRKQEVVENGDIAVVLVGDDEATVKRFYRVEDTVTLEPQSFNPEHKVQIYDLKNTYIRILGKVVQSQIDY